MVPGHAAAAQSYNFEIVHGSKGRQRAKRGDAAFADCESQGSKGSNGGEAHQDVYDAEAGLRDRVAIDLALSLLLRAFETQTQPSERTVVQTTSLPDVGQLKP